jgi:pimeloyl-ACP methyl ester carboxylesterase
LRDAVLERFGEVQTYRFRPLGRSKGTVLLIHGWAAEAAFMAAFAEPLRRIGFEVVALDLPAHGLSKGQSTNLAACARAAHGVAQLYAPLHGIVAHSLGGLVALWLAEGGPPLPSKVPVGKIALLACPNRFVDVAREFGAEYQLCQAAQLGFERHLSCVGQRPVESFSAERLLGTIESRVLAVHSRDDGTVPYCDALAIAAAHSKAILSTLEHLGHAGLICDPGVIRNVRAFLCDEHLPPPSQAMNLPGKIANQARPCHP